MYPNQKLSIAFLTYEYITQHSEGTGLGFYVQRMAYSLAAVGHRVTIVSLGRDNAEIAEAPDVTVHIVKPELSWWLRIIMGVARRSGYFRTDTTLGYIIGSLALVQKLAELEQRESFDIVQTSNYGLTGLFLPKRSGQVHMMRLSSDQLIWRRADGIPATFDLRCKSMLERYSLRRADSLFAPSRHLATQVQQRIHRPVNVIYPPFHFPLERIEDRLATHPLPPRYLIHFGRIGLRKGSDLVAKALRLAWEQEPDLKIVWAGREAIKGDWERCRAFAGPACENLIYLGPVQHKDLLAIVCQAEASLLPSRVDNLPNTALESLYMKVPVIGTYGSSLDEIIEPGKNGELVNIDDVDGLAQCMLSVWRGDVGWRRGHIQLPTVFNEMTPGRAAENFLKLAKQAWNASS